MTDSVLQPSDIPEINLSQPLVICWFRQDLRLADNPAFIRACSKGRVLPVYILDNQNCEEHGLGGASRWWLHHSLCALNESLDGNLALYKGDPVKIFKTLVTKFDVRDLYWNRCYEPWRIARDKKIKADLAGLNVLVSSSNGSLLWEPWEVLKNDGTPYKVFTPFYRRGCLNRATPRMPEPAPANPNLVSEPGSLAVEDLGLLSKHEWPEKLEPHWQIGEQGAQGKLKTFIDGDLAEYKEGRNFPALNSVSGLSPHIHFGEVSPNQVWYAAKTKPMNDDLDCFLSEMGWREFSHSLLYHFPDFPRKNLQTKFDHFPWLKNDEHLKYWQQGQTGHPLIDAGMRELWQTGYMHNRVRMVVGSFLVKNLLLHWHHGEKWFWDCLVDADLANNSAGWQWIAGCGADAAPYFRVFNPATQGEKFDKQGEYTRRFVPELKDIPDKYLYRPWEAPQDVLAKAGVVLGDTYPEPIVDLKQSRLRALEAFKSLSASLDG